MGKLAATISAFTSLDERLAELRACEVRQRFQLGLAVGKWALDPLGTHPDDVKLAELGL
jgi:hypothetical protein